ncbi:hypothetical protein [Lysinibacter cavernae]|uniref:Uncharacterized protein n=1 Tax=Lysinibacter cavernae TaxID=1640652 RepID=A0A7X5TU61_9MICO|nr:hypothetical protein [Lysinibacter cavernae]NIH54910.1 hypothetical protein [Lysinibacter cavernae]
MRWERYIPSGFTVLGLMLMGLGAYVLLEGYPKPAMVLFLTSAVLFILSIVLWVFMPVLASYRRAQRDIAELESTGLTGEFLWVYITRPNRKKLKQFVRSHDLELCKYLHSQRQFVLMINPKGVWIFRQEREQLVGEILISRRELIEAKNGYVRVATDLSPALILETVKGPIAVSPHLRDQWYPVVYQPSDLRTLRLNLNAILMDDPSTASAEGHQLF